MLEDQENKHHKHQALEADPNLQNLVQVLDQFVPVLDDLKHADHSCHSNNLIKFPDLCHSSKFVIVSQVQN